MIKALKGLTTIDEVLRITKQDQGRARRCGRDPFSTVADPGCPSDSNPDVSVRVPNLHPSVHRLRTGSESLPSPSGPA